MIAAGADGLTSDLIGESTTLLAVVVVAFGAFKLYRYLRSDQRRNVQRWQQYAVNVVRMLPNDVEPPPWPLTEPEVDDNDPQHPPPSV